MKCVGGMWLPDGDRHFATVFAPNGRYHQEHLIEDALEFVRSRELAFDIGAHVGYLTRKMLEYFDRVVAWGPAESNYECLVKNVDMGRVETRQWAVSDYFGCADLRNPAPENSGAWEMVKGAGPIVVGTLMEGTWPGLVKIDVQGMEAAVLRGGERLFKTAKPVIVIEANDENGVSALLEGWGARRMMTARRDQIWAWPVTSDPLMLEK